MLKLSFNTAKSEQTILDEAESFFTAEGLTMKTKGDHYMLLEGGGGYVRIDVADSGKSEVTLETREWEYQVKQFAEKAR